MTFAIFLEIGGGLLEISFCQSFFSQIDTIVEMFLKHYDFGKYWTRIVSWMHVEPTRAFFLSTKKVG